MHDYQHPRGSKSCPAQQAEYYTSLSLSKCLVSGIGAVLWDSEDGFCVMKRDEYCPDKDIRFFLYTGWVSTQLVNYIFVYRRTNTILRFSFSIRSAQNFRHDFEIYLCTHAHILTQSYPWGGVVTQIVWKRRSLIKLENSGYTFISTFISSSDPFGRFRSFLSIWRVFDNEFS